MLYQMPFLIEWQVEGKVEAINTPDVAESNAVN